MAWTSSLPDAVDAFVTALAAAPALAGVGLKDGPRVVSTGSRDVLEVGYADEVDDTAATGDFTPEGLGVEPDRERHSVRCAAVCVRGNGDISAARRAVYVLLATVGGVLAADPTLGGVVMSARLGSVTLQLAQGDRGAVARLIFNIGIDAYTQEN